MVSTIYRFYWRRTQRSMCSKENDFIALELDTTKGNRWLLAIWQDSQTEFEIIEGSLKSCKTRLTVGSARWPKWECQRRQFFFQTTKADGLIEVQNRGPELEAVESDEETL